MQTALAKKFNGEYLSKYGIYIGFLIIFIIFSVISPCFFSRANIFNIIVQSAIISLVAIGQTVVITSAGIDLSVGSTVAFVSISLGLMMVAGVPIFLAIIISLIIGGIIGLFNGIIIAYGKVPAFIMTLGMMSMGRGAALALNGGKPVSRLPIIFGKIASTSVLGIPIFVIYVLIFYFLMYVLMNKNKLGRYFYAVGDNKEAARLSGIKVKKIEMLTYIFSGFFAAVGGIMLTARLNYATPLAGQGYELDAIAAVVIGGTALSGGKGNIMGTLIGGLLLGTLRNGLSILNVPGFYQKIIIGAVIVLAVFFDKIKGD